MAKRIFVYPGEIYTQWTVTGEMIQVDNHYYVPCRCYCGTERSVRPHKLKTGLSMSCGCLKTMESEKAMEQLITVWNALQEDGRTGEWPNWLAFKRWSLRNGFKLNARLTVGKEGATWMVPRRSRMGPTQQKINLQ